ncbi:MAG: lactate racemase domain-containing protein, partial [Arachnia sp.]
REHRSTSGPVIHHEPRRAANAVELGRQADILVASVWGAAFESGNPAGSPINAAHHVLVEQAGSHLGTPLLRESGVVVAMHPLVRNFSNRIQSAAADFFSHVLPETLDPAEIHARFENDAVNDPWYLNLYREGFAHHPLRVFHMWYRMQAASSGLSDVIWVGGDRRSAAVMGHRGASTLADAYEMASAVVGSTPNITHLHGPGRLLGIVS